MNFPDLLNFIFLFCRNTTHFQNPAWSCKTHAGGQIHQGKVAELFWLKMETICQFQMWWRSRLLLMCSKGYMTLQVLLWNVPLLHLLPLCCPEKKDGRIMTRLWGWNMGGTQKDLQSHTKHHQKCTCYMGKKEVVSALCYRQGTFLQIIPFSYHPNPIWVLSGIFLHIV